MKGKEMNGKGKSESGGERAGEGREKRME